MFSFFFIGGPPGGAMAGENGAKAGLPGGGDTLDGRPKMLAVGGGRVGGATIEGWAWLGGATEARAWVGGATAPLGTPGGGCMLALGGGRVGGATMSSSATAAAKGAPGGAGDLDLWADGTLDKCSVLIFGGSTSLGFLDTFDSALSLPSKGE